MATQCIQIMEGFILDGLLIEMLLVFKAPVPLLANLTFRSKREVPRDVRNSKVRKEKKFGRDCSRH